MDELNGDGETAGSRVKPAAEPRGERDAHGAQALAWYGQDLSHRLPHFVLTRQGWSADFLESMLHGREIIGKKNSERAESGCETCETLTLYANAFQSFNEPRHVLLRDPTPTRHSSKMDTSCTQRHVPCSSKEVLRRSPTAPGASRSTSRYGGVCVASVGVILEYSV